MAKKFTKNPFLGGSRSFKVIDVDKSNTLSLVLVLISNMSLPSGICNRFQSKRDNSSKITSFRKAPLFDASVRREPLYTGARNFDTKNWSLWGSHGKDFVILACTVLIGLQTAECHRQTDRRPGHG